MDGKVAEPALELAAEIKVDEALVVGEERIVVICGGAHLRREEWRSPGVSIDGGGAGRRGWSGEQRRISREARCARVLVVERGKSKWSSGFFLLSRDGKGASEVDEGFARTVVMRVAIKPSGQLSGNFPFLCVDFDRFRKIRAGSGAATSVMAKLTDFSSELKRGDCCCACALEIRPGIFLFSQIQVMEIRPGHFRISQTHVQMKLQEARHVLN